jgi:hypothetical protein
MRRTGIAPSCRWPLVLSALAWAGGCTASRPQADEPVLVQRRESAVADQQQLLEGVLDKLVTRLESQAPSDAQTGPAEPTLDLLLISGGGEYGAFGAGFLSGWGQVDDPAFKRPAFDIVCGVSTGAIIAPFAFAGTSEAYDRIEWFYRHPEPDWIELRDWFSFLPWRPSLFSNDGIRKSLEKAVSPRIVRQVAARSSTGSALLVAATDLDNGAMVLMDLGSECEDAVQIGSRQRALSVLLASSAIPAAFPPVPLDNGLYADGGITSIPLSQADLNPPRAIIDRWRQNNPGAKPPLIRYWVLLNIRIQAPPAYVEPQWSSVGEAALQATIRSSTWLQARLLAAQLDYLNAKGWARCELRVASIPEDWRPLVEGEFHARNMNQLADLGRQMGANTGSWLLLTEPVEDR